MSQSTLIIGGALLAFLVWVTLNGHLSNYLSDLGLAAGSAANPVSSAPDQTGLPAGLGPFGLPGETATPGAGASSPQNGNTMNPNTQTLGLGF